MTHLVTTDHRVVTTGSAGQVIAVTRWTSCTEASAYAQRMASFVGGTVRIEQAA